MDTYLKGFRMTAENAQRLYDAAVTLEEKSEYAIANSLLVLSAEEGMKALTILARHFMPNLTQEDFDKSFGDHKHKIEGIRNLMGFLQIIEKTLELYYLPLIENLIEPKRDVKIVKNESLENLKTWLKSIVDRKDLDILKQNSWWRSAKSIKENGFYVNYRKGRWTNPTSIKKEGYLKSKEYVNNFLCHVKMFYKINLDDTTQYEMFTSAKEFVESTYKHNSSNLS